MAKSRTPNQPPQWAPTADEAARILNAVRDETRTYTDPRAGYPLAVAARDAQTAGAMRRSK